jgi:hypothetical protein
MNQVNGFFVRWVQPFNLFYEITRSDLFEFKQIKANKLSNGEGAKA